MTTFKADDYCFNEHGEQAQYVAPAGSGHVVRYMYERGDEEMFFIVKGRGTLRYEVSPNDPGEQLLDFPVSGLPVTISQGEVTFFSGTAPVAPGA